MSTYSEAALIKITCSGRNNEGVISVPGLKVGDLVLVAARTDTADAANTAVFRPLVAADDELYQASDGVDYSSRTFVVLLARI